MTDCYKTHPPLPLSDYKIYGGKAAEPIIRDADIYVSLQDNASCKLAEITFDARRASFLLLMFRNPSRARTDRR